MAPRRRPRTQKITQLVIARKQHRLRAPRLNGGLERWLAEVSPAALRKKLEVTKDG